MTRHVERQPRTANRPHGDSGWSNFQTRPSPRAAAGAFDQDPKQPSLAGLVEQEFRVPLHTKHKRPPGELDGLDDAVEVAAGDHQAGAEAVDALAM